MESVFQAVSDASHTILAKETGTLTLRNKDDQDRLEGETLQAVFLFMITDDLLFLSGRSSDGVSV